MCSISTDRFSPSCSIFRSRRRLNIQNGPNTEQMVREFPSGQRDVSAEFDLAYSKINEKRVEKAWIDLIFENPQMNQITLRDLTFSRRPRAQL